MAYFPMFIEIEKKHCLIVGGGNVALRKVRVLLEFGADVTVVAPQILPAIEQISSQNLHLKKRAFEETDLNGCTLVVAATDDAFKNHAVAKLAKERNIPVNAVDQQEDCSFLFPSYHKEKNVVGAFSSSGNSPVITQYLKGIIQEVLDEDLGEINEYMGSIRPLVKQALKTEALRKQVYQKVLKKLLTEKVHTLSDDELQEIIRQVNSRG